MPSNPPSSALTEPCMPLSGTANGAGTAANVVFGWPSAPGANADTTGVDLMLTRPRVFFRALQWRRLAPAAT